jgi:hypothetical protein
VSSPDAPDLNAIEARANAATPGPWEAYPDAKIAGLAHIRINPGTMHPTAWPADAAFIARARTDVPALVAALRAAETKLAAIQALAQLWTASDNVDDLHTRVTNRAYAGVLLDVLDREGEPT